MLAMKEIGGGSGIDLRWTKPGEGTEWSARPFPAITHKLTHSEGAIARGRGVHRLRIPTLEIEITVGRRRICVAPRIQPALAGWGAVCCAMELALARQSLPYPACISFSLLLGDVNRPVERQRKVLEHASVVN